MQGGDVFLCNSTSVVFCCNQINKKKQKRGVHIMYLVYISCGVLCSRDAHTTLHWLLVV